MSSYKHINKFSEDEFFKIIFSPFSHLKWCIATIEDIIMEGSQAFTGKTYWWLIGLTSLTYITGKTMVLMFPVSLQRQKMRSFHRHPHCDGTLDSRDKFTWKCQYTYFVKFTRIYADFLIIFANTYQSEVRFLSV